MKTTISKILTLTYEEVKEIISEWVSTNDTSIDDIIVDFGQDEVLVEVKKEETGSVKDLW